MKSDDRFFWVGMVGFIVVIAGFFIVTTAMADKDCQGYAKTESGRIAHQASLPANVYYDKSVPKEMIHELKLAIKGWDLQMKRSMFNLSGPLHTHHLDGQNIIFWRETWDPRYSHVKSSTAMGVSEDDGVIVGSDTNINAVNFGYLASNPANDPRYLDAESFFMEQLGFILGLKISQDPRSIMFSELEGAQFKTLLAPSDIANVECMYGK